MKSHSEFVELMDGPTLPVEVIDLAIALEARGFTMRAEGDKLWVGSPVEVLTSEETDLIRKWKQHLLVVVSYCATYRNTS